MSQHTNTYDRFATLFSYPSQDFKSNIESLKKNWIVEFACQPNPSDDTTLAQLTKAKSNLESFHKTVLPLTIEEMEELYTRTFDINPIASLELGWHLFGETYERGSFLVKMRELLRTYQIDESSELPDHLTHVLLVLGRMEKTAADEFASKYVIPGLNKILEGFQQGKDQPYEFALHALKSFIEQQHCSNTLDCKQGVEPYV